MPWRPNYRKLSLLGILVLLYLLRDTLVAGLLPFALAFILAATIEPVVLWLQRRLRFPRGAAVFVTLGALILGAGYLLTIVLAKIAAELVELAGRLPAYQTELMAIVDQLLARLNELYEYLPVQVSIYLENTISDLSRSAVVIIGDAIDRTLRAITSLPSILVVMIVTVLATYFLSRDREQLTNALFRLAPERWQAPLREAQEKIVVDLIGFLKGQLLIFFVTTAIAAGGLFLIGTRFWMLLGIILGILDLIPVVGPGLIIFPWAGLSLLMEEPQRALFLGLLFVAILATRQTAQATILGDSIGVHPLAMLVAVYGGVVAFGIRGVIIGPLLVIIGKAVWNSGLIPRGGLKAAGEPVPPPPAEAETGGTPGGAATGLSTRGSPKKPSLGDGQGSPPG